MNHDQRFSDKAINYLERVKKVSLFIAMSLDGYIADSKGGVSWLTGQGDDSENIDSYSEFVKDIDTILMGRNTYHQLITELSPDVWVYDDFITYVITREENVSSDKIIFANENPGDLIKKLNDDKTVNGILLQSPLPQHLDINEAFRTIDYRKDVDGFHPMNVGKLVLGQDTFVSCTPYGIMRLFEEYNIDLCGKNVVILGRSNIVGKPLVQCCLNNNATVTICHSKTKDIKEVTKNADVLVVAIGKPHFLEADMVKDGAIIIDVGINRLDTGKIVGDVDFENVSKKASYITPVPGGVGPMTIAMLMNNVIKATKEQNGI